MGRRGPRPQPSALRVLRGSRRSSDVSCEPAPPEGDIRPPLWLAGPALQKWNELLPLLQGVRVMTQADVGALARYCDSFAWWRRCRDTIEAQGDTITIRDANGAEKYHQQRPEVGIVNKLAQQLHRLEVEFGLTPSARRTIHVSPQQPRDELEEFFLAHGERA